MNALKKVKVIFVLSLAIAAGGVSLNSAHADEASPTVKTAEKAADKAQAPSDKASSKDEECTQCKHHQKNCKLKDCKKCKVCKKNAKNCKHCNMKDAPKAAEGEDAANPDLKSDEPSKK